MEFRKMSLEDFNLQCDTTLNSNMSFNEAMNNIESANNNYFYTSMCKNDVIEAYNNEIEVARQLDLEFVFIDDLGIYIALQP